MIPAGYYGIVMLGPGGCIQQPIFHLKGPGEELINDMSGGEVTSEFYNAYLAPSSTYTWRLDTSDNAAVYTFVTNNVVGGTPPSTSPAAGTATGSGAIPTSQDIVGSAVAPFRGTLAGAISRTGTLTLAFKGHSVTHLAAGRYTIAVVDRSGSSGFDVQKRGKRAVVSVTGGTFVGKRSLTVDLTSGTWTFMPRPAQGRLRDHGQLRRGTAQADYSGAAVVVRAYGRRALTDQTGTVDVLDRVGRRLLCLVRRLLGPLPSDNLLGALVAERQVHL